MQGATFLSSSCLYSLDNFNPRSLCRERPIPDEPYTVVDIFQSTLPMQGATNNLRNCVQAAKFQSTLPMQGATSINLPRNNILDFSIHAPYAGSDVFKSHLCSTLYLYFNPRSLCRERRIIDFSFSAVGIFQSTLPMQGATAYKLPSCADAPFQSTLPMQGATSIC